MALSSSNVQARAEEILARLASEEIVGVVDDTKREPYITSRDSMAWQYLNEQGYVYGESGRLTLMGLRHYEKVTELPPNPEMDQEESAASSDPAAAE